MDINKIIDELIEISKSKHRYLNITLGIEKKLSEYINESKIENIARQIELKDKYNSIIQRLDMDFYTHFNRLKHNLGIESIDKIDSKKYPHLKELKRIVGEIVKLDEEINTINNQNMIKMKNASDEIINKLRGINLGKNVALAYKTQKNLLNSSSFYKKK